MYKLCFYSTYEELKHGYKGEDVIIFEGFYSTYEELKLGTVPKVPFVVNMFLQYLWGIETRRNTYYDWWATIVFTVPMRNWNLRTKNIWFIWFYSFYSTYEELKHND